MPKSQEHRAERRINIPKISHKDLTVGRFIQEFMIPNTPVIITGLVDEWPAMTWVRGDGTLDCERICSKYGTSCVTVHDCSHEIKGMGRLDTKEMTVNEYFKWWRERLHDETEGDKQANMHTRGHKAAASRSNSDATLNGSEARHSNDDVQRSGRHVKRTMNRDVTGSDHGDGGSKGDAKGHKRMRTDVRRPEEAHEGDAARRPLWYLKDWNFAKEYGAGMLYDCPALFEDDWLNEWERQMQHASDHRFVYIGPKTTFTPLHRDTLCSYSWTSNVLGVKKWWMFAPEHESNIHDSNGEQLFDIRNFDRKKFPNAALAEADMIEFDQLQGETVFVPSGWWHQVLNVDDCFSINHNWLNAANIQWGWELLRKQRDKVLAELGDEGDEGSAQDVMEFRYGLSFEGFFNFLTICLRNELKRAGSFAANMMSSTQAVSQDDCGKKKLRMLGLEKLSQLLREVGRTEACEFICEEPKEMRRVKAAMAGLERAWRVAERRGKR